MLLTIDIGTTIFKSSLWDYDGRRLAAAGEKLKAGCEGWLRAFENCCRSLGKLSAVEALVICGNGPTLVPVTGEPSVGTGGLCVPAEDARFWLDRKAVKYGEEVSKVMGGFVDAGFFLPKILNIKNEEKELYDKTKCFLGCPEYLAYALTGEVRTVFPSEGFDRWFWDDNALKKLELDAGKFPAFIRPGDRFGTITNQAAEYFGFAKNIPVISGGPDFFAAILGAGVTQPSQACDRSGSSEGINLCTAKRVEDTRLMSYGHPVKPYWNLSGIINTTGKAIEWCLNHLKLESYPDFFSLAGESKPGSGGLVFVPYLAGERAPVWNPGLRGIWHGIGLSTGRGEFARSVLEGIGFAIRDVLCIMEESGEKASHLRVTGGLAAHEELNQIKADITGLEILDLECEDAGQLGLAIIGSCAKGKYASFSEACSAMVRIKRRYESDSNNAAMYDGLFQRYGKIRETSVP
jgi:xylulokinase